TIEKSVERLRRSLDELLALLRLEQAVPGEAREPVDYPAFLDGLLEDYRSDPRWAGWRFTLTVGQLPPLSLNRARGAGLWRNRRDSARGRRGAGGGLGVGARRRDGAVVTSVRAHGPGISPENRKRIFQRFFPARPAGAPPGTGLGLSVVETI